MERNSLTKSVYNLWCWLETWVDSSGGLHSYVVHHHRDCFRFLMPDAWTQPAAILGLLSLYAASGEQRWLTNAKRMCDYLVANYLWDLHVYRNSNYEKKPLGNPSLIENALPSYALLKFASLRRSKSEEWARYFKVVKDNVDNFIVGLWDDQIGAFRGWPHQQTHIHNKNSSALMTLTALSEFEGDESYLNRFGKHAADFALRCQVKSGPFRGAYPYLDTLREYIALYTLITAYGLLVYYDHTHEDKILESVENALYSLVDKLDMSTGFMTHYYRTKYPEWILDTFFFLNIAKRLEKLGVNMPVDKDAILKKALSTQYNSGAFPLSIGFARRGLRKSRAEPHVRKLRDLMPVPSWNSWNFWLLSEILPSSPLPQEPSISFPLVLKTDNGGEISYQIYEDLDSFSVLEQPSQRLMYLVDKKSDVCIYNMLEENDLASTVLRKVEKLPSVIRRPLYFMFRRF